MAGMVVLFLRNSALEIMRFFFRVFSEWIQGCTQKTDCRALSFSFLPQMIPLPKWIEENSTKFLCGRCALSSCKEWASTSSFLDSLEYHQSVLEFANNKEIHCCPCITLFSFCYFLCESALINCHHQNLVLLLVQTLSPMWA